MRLPMYFKPSSQWSRELTYQVSSRNLNTPTPSLKRDKTPSNVWPGYHTKQPDGEVPGIVELCGMQSTYSLSSLPGPLWVGVVASDRVLSMGQIELNCVNWIVWNRTILICKLCTYAKLNCLKWNCFCMQNWIVWKTTVFDIETVLTLNWIIFNRNVLTFNRA